MRTRDILNRRIVGVNLRLFWAGHGRGRVSDPELILDNGTVLRFLVRETDIGEYGVQIIVCKPVKKEKS